MNLRHPPSRRWLRRTAAAVGTLSAIYVLLLIPDHEPTPSAAAGRAAFAWNRDDLWQALETGFAARRNGECGEFNAEIDGSLADLSTRVDALVARPVASSDAALDELERAFFLAAPAFGACTTRVPELIAIYERIRKSVKDMSRTWQPDAPASRDRVYRLLYGGRAAMEELLLQMPPADALSLARGTNEPCAGPTTEVHAVRVCSGDLLVSRGGAPTSALIARGNDYPGNFSHVALAHVGEGGDVSVIEAHIERGVVVSTLDDYLADKKRRIMVLRLRSDHPVLLRNPTLAHQAATAALEEARTHHVPYDFEMDLRDHTKRFCSEVASAAYEPLGIQLWLGLSSMSTRGVVGWLGSFGVRHFETQAPADLEYDPQLVVVAEWRAPEALERDHLDNAIIDAMLEQAEQGEQLRIERAKLPLVRVAKMWSVALNQFGAIGPIPEGMSATVALRTEALRSRHAAIERAMEPRVAQFRTSHGYAPPYWRLVEIAREAASQRSPQASRQPSA